MSDGFTVAIGVDALFFAKGRWWCHLLCDDFRPEGLAQLHRFARRLGVPARAFHNPCRGQPRPHYDLTPEFREKALACGARTLTQRDLVEFLRRGRLRLQEAERGAALASEVNGERTPPVG